MGSTPVLPGGESPGVLAWLKRPENRTTAIFLGIAGVALFWFWGIILPFVLAVMDGTLQSIYSGLAIAASLYLIFGERPRIFYRIINRWITGWFVNLDPIGIREDHIAETLKRKAEADKAIGSVRGLRIGLAKRVSANKMNFKAAADRLALAVKISNSANPNPEQLRQAQRCKLVDSPYYSNLETLLDTQSKQLERYDQSIERLTRLGEFCDDVILRKQREIEIEKENLTEQKGLRTVRGAMSAIFGKGGGAGEEMDDMAREKLESDYTEEMGQFDQFMSGVSDIIAKDDFSNLAAMQAVEEKFSKLDAIPMPVKQGGIPVEQVVEATSSKKSYF